MSNKNVKMALEGPIVKTLVTLAVPILLANLLQSAYQLIDAYWVGRLGGDAVASVSVSFPITFLMISLGTGFAIAGSTLIAQYVGAKNQKMVNHVAAQTLLLVAVVSALLGGLGYAFSPAILKIMGVSPAVLAWATAFMRISFVGLVFVFGFFMFQSIMRGVGEVKMPLYIVLWTVCLNYVLDPLFIFGYGPVAGMGVAGAAFATLLTQWMAATIGFVLLFTGKYPIHLKLADFRPDFDYIKRAFYLGFPTSMEMSTRGLGLVVMTFLISSFGTLAVASYGVGSTILQVVTIPAMGLAMATSVLIGQNIGAGNMARAEKIAKTGMFVSFGLLSAIGLVVFATAPWLVGFFIPSDVNVIAGGTSFVRAMALFFGFIGVQLAISATFRASGNMIATLVISLVSQWVVQFPVAYVLSKHTGLGVDGLWYSFPISNVITTVVSFLWFMNGSWKKTLVTEDDRLTEQVSEETIIAEGVR